MRHRCALICIVLVLSGAASPNPQTEGTAIVRRHADELERDAKRLQSANAPAAQTVARAADALRTALAFEESDDNPTTRPSRSTKDAKVRKVPLDQFLANEATSFPPAQNVARGGAARASSTHADAEDALTVLGGSRRRDGWVLAGDKGQLELAWAKPVEARFVLLFNRSDGFGDHWQASTIHVNGRRVATVDLFRTGQVLVVDLGEVTQMRSMRLEIKGIACPGLAGLELHKRAVAPERPARK